MSRSRNPRPRRPGAEDAGEPKPDAKHRQIFDNAGDGALKLASAAERHRMEQLLREFVARTRRRGIETTIGRITPVKGRGWRCNAFIGAGVNRRIVHSEFVGLDGEVVPDREPQGANA